MKLKKGFIEILAGKRKGKQISILYFPTEYSLKKGNSFTELAIPGLESPYIQYVKGNAATMTLEVFYDTYQDEKDVRTISNELSDLILIDTELHAPPPLRFIWGMENMEPFTCVLEDVTRRFTMFMSNGTPVRARLNITLKEYKEKLSPREKAVQSPDKSKIYTVKEGDNLQALANREYGSPFLWRVIADENDINDPRFLEPGKQLLIPPLE